MLNFKKVKSYLSSTVIGSCYKLMRNRRTRAQWYLNASMACFKREYDAYWDSVSQDRSATTMIEQFDQILQNGYSIIPNYLTEHQLEDIKREILSLDGFIEGNYTGPCKFTQKPKDGICGIEISEHLPCIYQLTVVNESLLGLAQALFGRSVRLTTSTVLNKYDTTKTDSSNIPHWDDWRVRFKAFIYLTDVNEENAPTIYFKGSVHDVPWRLEKDYGSVFLPTASAGGSWWPVEALGLEKIKFTGKAGTLILFDARGLHAGTQLMQGNRIMLMNMYTTHLSPEHRLF